MIEESFAESLAGDKPKQSKPSPRTGTTALSSEALQVHADTASNTTKSRTNDRYLYASPSRPSLDTLSGLSTYSLEEFSAVRSSARSLQPDAQSRLHSRSPAPPKSIRGKWNQIWEEQKGMVLMVFAQFFGAGMATIARFMQTTTENGPPMHTFQIVLVRMAVTALSCFLYMWWAKVPDAPFGKKEVRTLLLARGFGGFFGLTGLYFSLVYLPLSEATVITFLAPMVAAWVCSICIDTPFTRTQQLGFVVSIVGVLLVAQPFSFLEAADSTEGSDRPPSSNSTIPAAMTNGTRTEDQTKHHQVTPTEHLMAVGIGLVGVCGAASAYTTISWIGKRAHPLISITYFAVWCTFVSGVALIVVPDIPFRLPSTSNEWILMLLLGISGFVMQLLLTAALAHTRGGKGLNMVYTQMLFALAFDKLIWGTTPGLVSIVGSCLILGSAIWVAVKKEPKKEIPPNERPDEEEGLVAGMERNDRDGGVTQATHHVHRDESPELELQRIRI